jgi:hypothetical protein
MTRPGGAVLGSDPAQGPGYRAALFISRYILTLRRHDITSVS